MPVSTLLLDRASFLLSYEVHFALIDKALVHIVEQLFVLLQRCVQSTSTNYVFMYFVGDCASRQPEQSLYPTLAVADSWEGE